MPQPDHLKTSSPTNNVSASGHKWSEVAEELREEAAISKGSQQTSATPAQVSKAKTRTGCGMLLIAALISVLLITAGSALMALSFTMKAQNQTLLSEIQTVEATRTGCQTFHVASRRGPGFLRGRISYQFVFQDKVYIGSTETVPCEDLIEGSTLPIKFLPSDPTRSATNTEAIINDGSQNLYFAALICFIWSLFVPLIALGTRHWLT